MLADEIDLQLAYKVGPQAYTFNPDDWVPLTRPAIVCQTQPSTPVENEFPSDVQNAAKDKGKK